MSWMARYKCPPSAAVFHRQETRSLGLGCSPFRPSLLIGLRTRIVTGRVRRPRRSSAAT